MQVSAIGVDEPLPEDTGDVWRAYVEAKRDADEALRDSGLDWTIIRPGRLTDDPATGRVALGPDVERGDIPAPTWPRSWRPSSTTPDSVGKQWNLVNGDMPVEVAVRAGQSSPSAE